MYASVVTQDWVLTGDIIKSVLKFMIKLVLKFMIKLVLKFMIKLVLEFLLKLKIILLMLGIIVGNDDSFFNCFIYYTYRNIFNDFLFKEKID